MDSQPNMPLLRKWYEMLVAPENDSLQLQGRLSKQGEKGQTYCSVCLLCNHLITQGKIPGGRWEEESVGRLEHDGLVTFVEGIGFTSDKQKEDRAEGHHLDFEEMPLEVLHLTGLTDHEVRRIMNANDQAGLEGGRGGLEAYHDAASMLESIVCMKIGRHDSDRPLSGPEPDAL